MKSRPSFFTIDVATTERCRDLLYLHLMSRPLNDVATSSNSMLMLRPLLDVATSIWCRDLLVYCTAFNFVAASKWCRDVISFSSLIYGCLTWSFYRDQLVLPFIALLLRLEFCGRDLNINLHCCQGVTTSGPLILVHFSCCNLLRPVVSVLFSHFLLLLQYPLSLEFLAA